MGAGGSPYAEEEDAAGGGAGRRGATITFPRAQ